MKAIRVHQYGGPEAMRLDEVADLQPGPGQVRVRVKAAGVNPVDTYIRSGSYALKPPLPYTPGFDAAGIVDVLGAGVTRVKAGDRVYVERPATGSYAEQTLAAESQVHLLPERTSFAQGAGIGVPYGTAQVSLFERAHAQPAEFLMVHGASGGVGIAAVQLARAWGMTVIATAGSDKGRELVKREGAHHVLDHTSAGYLDEAVKLTGGRGVDLILEMLANVNLGKDLGILAKHGRVVVIGSRGPVEINPRDAMVRQVAIIGMTLLNASEKELEAAHSALRAGLENGTLRPVVRVELPLAEASKAHQMVMEPGACGKIVLIP
jgi:NADPH:quinone reductase